eukprot:3883018-Alexandrium_andersonii.AAC.1
MAAQRAREGHAAPAHVRRRGEAGGAVYFTTSGKPPPSERGCVAATAEADGPEGAREDAEIVPPGAIPESLQVGTVPGGRRPRRGLCTRAPPLAQLWPWSWPTRPAERKYP